MRADRRRRKESDHAHANYSDWSRDGGLAAARSGWDLGGAWGDGDRDETANRNYIKQFVLANDAALGKKYGLDWAEQFHHIGPEKPPVEEYVKQHAVPL